MKTLPVQFGEAAANIKSEQNGVLPTVGEFKEIRQWANSVPNVRPPDRLKALLTPAKRPDPIIESPEVRHVYKLWRELMRIL